ncbi:MAG: hypothetical protein AABY18_03770 [Candidatus Thermoplasmatota archaeon]
MADLAGMSFVWGMETPLLLVSLALAALGLWRFFPAARNRLVIARPNPGLGLTRFVLVLAAAWFTVVLTAFSDENIVGKYVVLYAALAFTCLMWGAFWRPVLGIWSNADVVERGNLAAALVIAGFALGTMFAFGGALTGEDASCRGEFAARDVCQQIRSFSPGETYGTGGWHVVLVFFLLAYLELRANMALVSRLGGGLADQARLDRDPSAGALLAAVAIASGLISGRAAAGDFAGWGPAFADYGSRIWPILLVPAVAALVGFLTTDRARGPLVRGITAVLLVAGAGAVYIFT